ncbi:MAG: sigma-70 family RNA polymerase sigma factor [Anaerolineae bacterium]|nr:sigma-70 family RNA polymerase sigma factor [Anaerolineae bacterium]
MSEELPVVHEWVEAALEGDQRAFGLLVEHYQTAVFNLAYRMLGEPQEAEDAAQEAFLRAYANLSRYDPERSFKTWLLSIASNHCIDRLRKRRLTWLSIEEEEGVSVHPALVSTAAGPEEAYLEQERSADIQALLARLPPDYRLVVVLRYWYDMSYTEIAEALNTSESAIKSRLFRARQTLADLMEGGPLPTRPMAPVLEGS